MTHFNPTTNGGHATWPILEVYAMAIVALLLISLPASSLRAAPSDAVVGAVADTSQPAKPEKSEPYSVHYSDTPAAEVETISPWKTIVLDPEYRGAWLVAGDVDGDGEVDIVSCRAKYEGGDHYSASIVVHRLDGSVLWKWGDPKGTRPQVGSDYACQIYDWDADGVQEVMVSAKEDGKTWLIELDGPTGKEKRRFQIPDNSADCIVFCNLSGNDHPTDILVKTRYTQIWAYNYDGEQLWASDRPGGQQTAHQPVPVDVDGDGKDEIQAGFALLNSDGSQRWALNGKDSAFDRGRPLRRGHLDCAEVFRLGESLSDTRIVLTFCGGERLAMVDGRGKMLWNIPLQHFESVDIGKVCADVPGKQIVVDLPYLPRGKKPIWILDEHGQHLGEILTDESRMHRLVDWNGDGIESIVVGEPPALYDGATGRMIARFDVPLPPGELPPKALRKGDELYLCWTGDMTGDGVADVIFGTNPGSVVYIYKNEKGKRPDHPVPLGTGVNVTLY